MNLHKLKNLINSALGRTSEAFVSVRPHLQRELEYQAKHNPHQFKKHKR